MRRFLGPIIYEITKGIAKAFGVDDSTIQIAFWLIVGALILVAICIIGLYEKKERPWCNRKNNHTDGTVYITQIPKDNSHPSIETIKDNPKTEQMSMEKITNNFEEMLGPINSDK